MPKFQSSPAPEGRCNARCAPPAPRPRSFNPHRPRRTGATAGEDRPGHRLCGFNPHRPRRTGATQVIRSTASRRTVVSILTGPGGPVQPGDGRTICAIMEVSILTGPGGPVQPGAAGTGGGCAAGFQSSPAPEDRCNAAQCTGWAAGTVSILTGPGGPVQRLDKRRFWPQSRVSILTGPGGPVQRGPIIRFADGLVVSILTGPGGPVQRRRKSYP